MTTLIQKATNWGKSTFLGLPLKKSAFLASAPEKTGVLPESGVRAIHFICHDDGTAIDTHTGLTWMRCAFGQTWDGRHCTGAAKPFAWDQAMALNHSFAGHNDWRVPDIDELQSLITSTRSYRNTYQSIFPNAPNAAHWSSSPSTKDLSLIQFVQLPSGSIETCAKYYGFGKRVRLVRGGKSPTSSTSPTGADTNSGINKSEINKSIEIVRIDAFAPKISGQDVLGGNIQLVESKQPMFDPINCDELYLADLLLQMEQGSTPSRELIDYVLGNPKKINDTAEVLSHPAQTLLHRATFLGRKLVAEWLVMKGADINAIDGDGKTPLDYAAAEQQMELANYLRSKGAFSTHFVDNRDGTVTDTRAGLTWMSCTLGQKWDGNACVGDANTYNWAEARALQHIFGGNNDWRLPTILELRSLVDPTRCKPSIDVSTFPNTPNQIFWSSSTREDKGIGKRPMVTDFIDGRLSVCDPFDGHFVRLVRKGQPSSSIEPRTSNTDNGINSVVGHAPFATVNIVQAADQTVPATIVDEVAYGSNGVPSGSISDSNGNSINEAKMQVTPEAILTNPTLQVPKFAYEQGAEPMVSVTTKHRDMDTPTQTSTQQDKANGVDESLPFETIRERLDHLEARFETAINRIEAVLVPISEDQSKTLDVINQLHLRSSVSTEKLSDELTQLQESIDCNESQFDASVNRIETDLKSLFQGPVKMMEAITLLHERSTADTNTFSTELAELRRVLVVALQSENAPTQVTSQVTANPQPDVIAVGDIYMFLEWLVGQDVIPLTELRIRLLPLDLLTSAVINDINERALDLTGEMALIESGDSVEVQQAVLKLVITAINGQSVFTPSIN